MVHIYYVYMYHDTYICTMTQDAVDIVPHIWMTYGTYILSHGTYNLCMYVPWLVYMYHDVGCQRRDRGIYSIRGGRSLYCLHFGISQLMGPEACFWIFVPGGLGWLSNRSLYQTFPENPFLLYQAVGTQANVAKIPFKLKGQINKICRRLLASPRYKGTDLLQKSGTSFGCVVNQAVLVQISQNMLRVQ